MKKRMVIIGANGSGTKRTIPALATSSLCEIVALQSRNQEKLQQTCTEYGIPNYYSDVEEMLRQEDFDLIFIANPPFLHLATIEQCLKYNKAIICEKPLARNYPEAQEIAKLLNTYPNEITIAHHLRHQPAYHELSVMLQNKRIGEVRSVWGQWGFNINPQAASSLWKLDNNLGGGGTFSDNGIHVIDFIVGLFGADCTVCGSSRLFAFKESFSNETLLMRYPDKDVVINSSHTMPFPGNHLLLYGTAGKIEIPHCFSEKSLKKIIITTFDQETILEYPEVNLYKNEVENFIEHCWSDSENPFYGTTLQEQLASLKIIDELRNSQQSSTSI